MKPEQCIQTMCQTVCIWNSKLYICFETYYY